MSLRCCFIFIVVLFFYSCNEDSKLEQDIAKINIDFQLERFEKDFQNAAPKDMSQLRSQYPFILAKRVPDSIYTHRMTDALQQELFSEVEKTFGNFSSHKQEVVQLFQHLKYYDPTFKTPRVVTFTNDVDYRNKTIVTDSVVLISLDCFLGKDHKFYQNLPKYIAANLNKKQIIPDLAERYAKKYAFQSQRSTFLDDMVYFGKLLYFKDIIIPFVSDAEKIGYVKEELAWAKVNESQIWSYFVENELLFSTDPKLANRFLALAPFSKFYKNIDNESPGRLGQFIGWQIVKSYAENNNSTLMDIMKLDASTLFENSYYKPKK